MDTIHNPQVTLKSGGYLVINQTEALVAIDVNSGRSTRERNIEETALKTNLEAADELARQLRLRDLSGLIVVDFIDMDENRNQQAVERRMKDAMRNDRARIQIGSISHFGLLEMSRQRLRLSFNESITSVCPHCEGTGRVRSVETAALQMLRVVEDEAAKGKMDELRISMNRDVALYILNHKRDAISALEERFGMHIVILAGDNLIATEHEVERIGWQGKKQRKQDKPASREPRRGGDNAEAGADASADGENAQPANDDEPADADAAASSDGDADSDAADDAAEAKPKRRRSRGRGKSAEKVAVEADETASGEAEADADATAEAPAEAVAEEDAEAKPKRRTRKKAAKPEPEAAAGDEAASEDAAAAETEAKPAAKKTRKKAAKSAGTAKKKTAKKAAKAKAAPAKAAEAPADDKPAAESGSDDDKRAPISSAPQDVIEVGSAEPAKRRTGWWNRG